MKAMMKVLVVVLVVAVSLYFWNQYKGPSTLSAQEREVQEDGKKKKKKGKKDKAEETASTQVRILDRWELPTVLTEISGLEYLGNNRFACIQDEQGTIYIYNTATRSIEREIPFAGAGDFEGIAIAGNSAYAVQSDGKIYEVAGFQGAKPVVKSYTTPLTVKHDVEGLTYDAKYNRLLLAIKGNDANSSSSKGIYAFDLKTKQLATTPVLKIDLTDPIFDNGNQKKSKNVMQPSEIEIHPLSGDIYISEGVNPKLLVMDAEGKKKNLYTMKSADFPQAEGVAFTPEGELFISNEGKNGKGTIIKVAIDE